MGVEKFSSFNKKSLEIHRAKKEKKFRRNASLLRQYQKVMKQEGYKVGKGASRRRTKDDVKDLREADKCDDDSSNGLESRRNISEPNHKSDEINSVKRRHKTNSFAKAKKEAQKIQKEKEDQIKAQKKSKKDKEAKILQRRKRSKVMGKRTTKGQPVMKNVISNMLEKLQKDALK